MSEKPTIYDETVRLEQATTAAPAECECVNWCSDGLHRREELLAGHHFRCAKFEAEFRRRALIVRVVGQMQKICDWELSEKRRAFFGALRNALSAALSASEEMK